MNLRKYWEEKPLLCIMAAGAFFRLLAVIFSKGYGMHDDHFLVIEAAQSWVDGHDYNNWLPTITKSVTQPTGHSLLYPGLHYFLLRALQFLGIYDPQLKMYVVRLIHAVLSMTIVYMGYNMVMRISGIKAAKMAGLLLALLFFMPMMSVRNLVEFVCIPPLMYATWLVMKNESGKRMSHYFIAGMLLGLACSIRFQTIFFSGGFGLALLLQKKWKPAVLVAFGIVSGIALIQSVTDVIIWHRPFIEMMEYVKYNMEHGDSYMTEKWYNYILTLAGLLIPPVSLFILFGFMRNWRRHLILFLPSFIFLVFHSAFPNKQERFILPVIPFIIMLGSAGWCDFMLKSQFWMNRKKLYRACWIFFWVINSIPLVFVSTTYSHRSRVEAMEYLSHKDDFRNLVVEESNHDDYTMVPLFYLRHWISYYYVSSTATTDTLVSRLKTVSNDAYPNYVLFYMDDNIDARIKNFKMIFPGLQYETTIEPGLVDKIMHWLNWHNANYTCYIYKMSK